MLLDSGSYENASNACKECRYWMLTVYELMDRKILVKMKFILLCNRWITSEAYDTSAYTLMCPVVKHTLLTIDPWTRIASPYQAFNEIVLVIDW